MAPPAEASSLAAAARANLSAALDVALLLSEARFSQTQLLRTICGLSYTGDVRMGWAEDRAKLERLVEGSRPQLEALYAPQLDAAAGAGLVERLDADSWRLTEAGAAADAPRLQGLPGALLHTIGRACGSAPGTSPAKALAAALRADRAAAQRLVQASLARIVRASSARQTALGLLSAGVGKSAAYGLAKLRKAWRSSKG